LEYRRRLAVQRVEDGDSIGDVADFLGVDRRTVRRRVAAFRQHGAAGVAAHPVPGRPPKLTPTQEKIVARWLAEDWPRIKKRRAGGAHPSS
jgi:transposase